MNSPDASAGWGANLRALSFDIVLGSLAGGAFAVQLSGARMPLAWWFVLPSTVWVIYTLDHLGDAYRVGSDVHSYRHRFHYRHFKILSISVALVAVLTLALALLELPGVILLGGVAVGFLTALHLLFSYIFKNYYPKEFSVALFYTAGIWFGPLLRSPSHSSWSVRGALFLHFTAALLNLFLFSLFEREQDYQEGHPSLVRMLGGEKMRRWIQLVTLVAVGSGILLLIFGSADHRLSFAILLLVNVGPYWMMKLYSYFLPRERYRTVGDALFLLLALPSLLSLM